MRRPWGTKPPVGVGIKQGHPLAQGLVWLGMPGADHRRELVSGGIGTLVGSATWSGNTRIGSAGKFTGASSDAVAYPWSHRLDEITTDFTIVAIADPDASLPHNGYFFSTPYDAAFGSPYVTLGYRCISGPTEVLFSTGSTLKTAYSVSNMAFTTDPTTVYAVSRQGDSVDFWLNGRFFINQTGVGTGALNWVNQQPPVIGGGSSTAATNGFGGAIAYVAIWNRRLTADEHAQIAADPFAFLEAPSWPMPQPPGAVLASVVAASASLVGALTVSKPLAAVVAASATVAGDLTVAKPVAAVVTAQAAITAALTVTKPLSATISASTALVADLTVAKPLAALVAAQAVLTASLDVTKPLAAVVAAQAAVTADLTVTKPLAAVVAASAAITANLTLPGSGSISAVIAVSATVSAALTVDKPLTAVVAGQAAVTADLTVAKPLSVVITAQGDIVAALTVPKPLAGVVAAQATVAADLTVAKPLHVVIIAGATITGALTVAKPLDAVIGANVVLVADLTFLALVPPGSLIGRVTILPARSGVVTVSPALGGVVTVRSALKGIVEVEPS